MSERVALVTGANRGIGFEVARQLAMQGDTVVLIGRNEERIAAAAEELGGLAERVFPCKIDITDDCEVREKVDAIGRSFGHIDVLVNNAAAHYDPDARVSTVDLATVLASFNINSVGAWRMIQAVLPFMPRSGGGRIVNVSSRAGSFGYLRGAMPAYTVSKTALNAITRHFASELADERILVNAVDPAASATDMSGGLGRSATESAATVVWVANLPDDGPTGGFFRDCEPIPW